MSPFVRSSIAALLLAVPVVVEATQLVAAEGMAEIAFVVGQLAGWLLIATVVRDLMSVAGGASRWGSRLVLAGVAFQVLFATAYGGSLLLTGGAAEASFLAFLLGFVCLTVGGALWSWRLHRRAGHREASLGLGGVAIFGFLAMAVGDNVVHEITLPLSYLAWTLVGRGIGSRSHPADVDLSAGSR